MDTGYPLIAAAQGIKLDDVWQMRRTRGDVVTTFEGEHYTKLAEENVAQMQKWCAD